ncbi:MAG: sigma-70 family RNA polymerase sigma factor [Bacteroidales bacterium]|nr:sigma-70 family RNA polymerase sigma factor [Bacteroidales bacterium]
MTEKELVRLVGDGDTRGQRELYERYAPWLTAVATRYLGATEQVKDLLQDSFIKVFDRFGSFRYKGEGSLKAWLTRIVVNDALHILRKTERLLPVENLPEPGPDEDPEVDNLPLEVLQGMISRLPDGYRTVFNLYVFEQMRHKDIAALLGIKENSSASQLLRAKALLTKEIKEYRKIHDNG